MKIKLYFPMKFETLFFLDVIILSCMIVRKIVLGKS